jgi:hypothetical protein
MPGPRPYFTRSASTLAQKVSSATVANLLFWKDKREYVHKAAGQPRFLGVQKQRWFSNAGRKTKDLENLFAGIFRLRNDLQCDLLLSGASHFGIPKRSVSFQRE